MTSQIKKILVANGVNLDLLGKREKSHYGSFTLLDLEKTLRTHLEKINQFSGEKLQFELEFYQSNHEAQFMQKLTEEYDGAIINPAAWTHTSLAIADRLKAVGLPFIETHISNIHAREEFRKHSFFSAIAVGVIFGLGIRSYISALYGISDYLQNN